MSTSSQPTDPNATAGHKRLLPGLEQKVLESNSRLLSGLEQKVLDSNRVMESLFARQLVQVKHAIFEIGMVAIVDAIVTVLAASKSEFAKIVLELRSEQETSKSELAEIVSEQREIISEQKKCIIEQGKAIAENTKMIKEVSERLQEQRTEKVSLPTFRENFGTTSVYTQPSGEQSATSNAQWFPAPQITGSRTLARQEPFSSLNSTKVFRPREG